MFRLTQEEINELEVLIRRYGIRRVALGLADLCHRYYRHGGDERWAGFAQRLEHAWCIGGHNDEPRAPDCGETDDAAAIRRAIKDFPGCPHRVEAATLRNGAEVITPLAQFAIASDARLYSEHLAVRLRGVGFSKASVRVRDLSKPAGPRAESAPAERPAAGTVTVRFDNGEVREVCEEYVSRGRDGVLRALHMNPGTGATELWPCERVDAQGEPPARAPEDDSPGLGQ